MSEFKIIIIPLFSFIVFITSRRPAITFKIQMSLIFIIHSWFSVYLLYFYDNIAYHQVCIGSLYIFSAFLFSKTFRGKNVKPHEILSFNCPFCSERVEFDIVDTDKSKNCPECHEVVTVTEDEEVHKAARKSYDEIMAAMECEDLQENPENLQDPSMAPSVFGFQFELNKGNSPKIENEDIEKKSV